jgi:hypothetical protein
MAAEGLRPFLPVVAGAVGRLVARHAAIDTIGGGEVDVVVEPGQHHLLDLERGLQEVHQRRVEREVRKILVERREPGLQPAERGVELSQVLLGRVVRALALGESGLLGGLLGIELLDLAPLLGPGRGHVVDRLLVLLDRLRFAARERAVVAVLGGVERRLGGAHASVGGVAPAPDRRDLFLEPLDLALLGVEVGLRLPDLLLDRRDLVLVDALALLVHLLLDRGAVEVAELGLDPLPRPRVVAHHHEQGDRQERQRRDREHHVHRLEVVVTVRGLGRRSGSCHGSSTIEVSGSDARARWRAPSGSARDRQMLKKNSWMWTKYLRLKAQRRYILIGIISMMSTRLIPT